MSAEYLGLWRPPTPAEARAFVACKVYALIFAVGIGGLLWTALNDPDGAVGTRISTAERQQIDELLGNERRLDADDMQLSTWRDTRSAASFSPEEAENASLLYFLFVAYAFSFPPVILVCSIDDHAKRRRAWVRLAALGLALLGLWRWAGNEHVLVPCLAALGISPFFVTPQALPVGRFRRWWLLLLQEEPRALVAACAAGCASLLSGARSDSATEGLMQAQAELRQHASGAACAEGRAKPSARATRGGSGAARAHDVPSRPRKDRANAPARAAAEAEPAVARRAEGAAHDGAREHVPSSAQQPSSAAGGVGRAGAQQGSGSGSGDEGMPQRARSEPQQGRPLQPLASIHQKLLAAGLSTREAAAAVSALSLPVLDSRPEHVMAAVRWCYARREAAEAEAAAAAGGGTHVGSAGAAEAAPRKACPAAEPHVPATSAQPQPQPPQQQQQPQPPRQVQPQPARPVAAAQSPAPAPSSLAEQLRELSELHAQGILTADEFSRAKGSVLGLPPPAAQPSAPPAQARAPLAAGQAAALPHGARGAGDAGLAACADSDCCVICLERHKTHVFVPADESAACMHKCVCERCADELKRLPRDQWLCPICRSSARDIKFVYD